MHYYVWYEVVGDELTARVAINRMMADLRHGTGIAGKLLRRRGRDNTWMEIYEGVTDPAAFESELGAALLRHDVVRFAALGRRHVETFVAAG